MFRSCRISLIIALALMPSMPAIADEVSSGPTTTAVYSAPSATADTTDESAEYASGDYTTEEDRGPITVLRFAYGKFSANKNAQLKNESAGYAGGLDIIIFPKRTFSYYVGLIGASRDYDSTFTGTLPPSITVDNRMSLDTTAVLAGIRATYPTEHIFRVHGSGGIGYFKNELVLGGTRAGLPGPVLDKVDTSFGYHLGLGIETDLGEWVLGLDVQHWFVHGSFDDFNLHNIDLGGNYIAISLGRYF